MNHVEPILINNETVKDFIENLKQKVFMVCFVYYSPNRDANTMIDIAKTGYWEDRWAIHCRGTGYLDYMVFDDFPDKAEAIVKKYVHSFIVCQEPKLGMGGGE